MGVMLSVGQMVDMVRSLRHATMNQQVPPAPASWPPASGFSPLPPLPSKQLPISPKPAQTPPAGPAGAGQGQPTHANVRKPSDQRFRSFAERYVVARAHLLTADPMKLAEEQYTMVLDAKRLYAMIERTGQAIQPEDGVF